MRFWAAGRLLVVAIAVLAGCTLADPGPAATAQVDGRTLMVWSDGCSGVEEGDAEIERSTCGSLPKVGQGPDVLFLASRQSGEDLGQGRHQVSYEGWGLVKNGEITVCTPTGERVEPVALDRAVSGYAFAYVLVATAEVAGDPGGFAWAAEQSQVFACG